MPRRLDQPTGAGVPAELTVRIASPEDEAAVSRLLEASYPVLMRDGYDDAVLAAVLPLMTRANPALLACGTFYLAAEDDGRLVGCGGWTRERPGSGEIAPELAHIRHFATHPAWLRRRVGHVLFDRCADHARAAGIRRLECYASLNAVDFYAALGFAPVRPMEVPMGPGLQFPALLMARGI